MDCNIELVVKLILVSIWERKYMLFIIIIIQFSYDLKFKNKLDGVYVYFTGQS